MVLYRSPLRASAATDGRMLDVCYDEDPICVTQLQKSGGGTHLDYENDSGEAARFVMSRLCKVVKGI